MVLPSTHRHGRISEDGRFAPEPLYLPTILWGSSGNNRGCCPWSAATEMRSRIEADPNQLLVVMTEGIRIGGTLQLTFIPGLARNGAWRGQIEAVRIAAGSHRSGLGRRMFEWAIAECRARGCSLIQLTTDKGRSEAHRFYEQFGFTASHLRYKLTI